MDEQDRVAAFVAEHDLDAPPAYRLLDLISEVGELAKAGLDSTGYGSDADDVSLPADEVGDVLFALLALADAVEIDAGDALSDALEKYERRIEAAGEPGSGR